MGQTREQRGKTPKHVRIFARQMQSRAWQDASPAAIKVLLTIASLERGNNNGALFLSDRKGAELTGLHRNTVRRALNELRHLGFTYCSEQGSFNRKTPHAASYGLTWLAGPQGSKWRAPSHAYESYQPPIGNTRALVLVETGTIAELDVETSARAGAIPMLAETEKRRNRVVSKCSKDVPQTVNQGQGTSVVANGKRNHLLRAGAAPVDDLRRRLIERLAGSVPGEQSRLADMIGCPGGTFSKFVNGRPLPSIYIAALTELLGCEPINRR